jgi:hypothetical protein
MLAWATNPLLRRVNVAIVLVTDSMAEMHPHLVTNPAVTTIDIPLPDAAERERFALAAATAAGLPAAQHDAVRRAAALSGGLSLESLRAVITMSVREGTAVDGPEFARMKTDLIERSCHGLVVFVQPRLTLDAVAGHVPGARTHPYVLSLAGDGRFLPPAALREALTVTLVGLPAERTVAMCGSGVTACHLLLALEHAGLRGARLYPGSWSEWSSDPSRPVRTGESP